MEKKRRPDIPAEVKRQVLVEAGHRCAIQRCKETVVLDIHHIIPWETCKEHKPENLIALCANCHRLAELGIIDRKSLRIYKKNCQQLVKPSQSEGTFIKFSVRPICEIFDSANIESLTDSGTLSFSFLFDKEFTDDNYFVSAKGTTGPANFEVVNKSEWSVAVIMQEPCSDIVRFDFHV